MDSQAEYCELFLNNSKTKVNLYFDLGHSNIDSNLRFNRLQSKVKTPHSCHQEREVPRVNWPV